MLTNKRELFENALIYHDSSAIAFFGNQMRDFDADGFCGNEYRSNELCAAVLNVQLSRMDGILDDLRKNKNYMMDQLACICEFLPSHDIAGDCESTLAIQFKTEEEARRFAPAEGIDGVLPIDTGKHIYKRWTPIMK